MRGAPVGTPSGNMPGAIRATVLEIDPIKRELSERQKLFHLLDKTPRGGVAPKGKWGREVQFRSGTSHYSGLLAYI